MANPELFSWLQMQKCYTLLVSDVTFFSAQILPTLNPLGMLNL
jgi:hypothetical protein